MTTTQRTIRSSAQQSVKRWDFLPPHHFPQIYDPVCGMDNQTYSNECFLRKAECSNMMVIQVANGNPIQPQNCERFATSGLAYWVRSDRTKIGFQRSAMLCAPLSTNQSAGQMVR